MRRLSIIALGTLALAGCAKQGGAPEPGKPVPIEADSSRYETGPCFGRCPVYTVTVRPDGTGVFEGKRFTAVSGEKAFTLSRAQYDAFAAKLAPYRPASGEVRYAPGEPTCPHMATDMPSVDVRWSRAIGDSQHLYVYYGCVMENQAIKQALGEAADSLPIQDLIGERP